MRNSHMVGGAGSRGILEKVEARIEIWWVKKQVLYCVRATLRDW
jgi:hypothetical protein